MDLGHFKSGVRRALDQTALEPLSNRSKDHGTHIQPWLMTSILCCEMLSKNWELPLLTIYIYIYIYIYIKPKLTNIAGIESLTGSLLLSYFCFILYSIVLFSSLIDVAVYCYFVADILFER